MTAIALLVLVAQVSVTTSGPPPPIRDNLLAKGTASIKGRVLAGDSGRPIRRVQVSLSAQELGEAKSISTTADGLFEFKDLPPGRYTIAASKPGYIRLQYGQKRPGEPGRPVQLAEAQ